MGFAMLVTIRSKLPMQRLWKMQIHWDEPLKTDLSSEWLSIAQAMSQLHNILIDRRYTSKPFDHTKVGTIYTHSQMLVQRHCQPVHYCTVKNQVSKLNSFTTVACVTCVKPLLEP